MPDRRTAGRVAGGVSEHHHALSTLIVMSDDVPTFQPLDQRLAGVPLSDTLRAGVPEDLERPLRDWLANAAYDELAQRVLLRLHWPSNGRYKYSDILANLTPREDLLIAVDAVLQLHPFWQNLGSSAPSSISVAAGKLEQILTDSGSELRLNRNEHRLERRVDETVANAANNAAHAGANDSRSHLSAAWAAAYGLTPEPDTSYRESVRAVEAVACPLVLPAASAASKATLGTVIGELRNNSAHLWEFVLPTSSGVPQDVSRLVEMLEMLWQGQVSRHGGGANSRKQSQSEAEAAVHLAATLVQWFSSGAVRRK